ncbi:hypothetical protein NEICINOT_04526, partial [Neisseria cinerea ATCC 14685]
KCRLKQEMLLQTAFCYMGRFKTDNKFKNTLFFVFPLIPCLLFCFVVYRQSLIFKIIVVRWLEERLAKGARCSATPCYFSFSLVGWRAN